MSKAISLNVISSRGKWYVYVRGTKIKLLSGLSGNRADVDSWIASNRAAITEIVAKSDRRFLDDKKSWRRVAAAQIHSVTSRRAKRRGIAYELDTKSIEKMLARADDKCEVSGVQFSYLPKCEDATWHRRPYMPSIDRIKNCGGYSADNVRVVAVCVNISINEWGEDVFWDMVRSASDKLQNVLQNP